MSGQITDHERVCRLRLSQSDNVGPATYHQLIDLYGSACEAIEALPELVNRHSNGARGRQIRLYPYDKAMSDLDIVHKMGGELITHGEDDYPYTPLQTDNPPAVLFVQGILSFLDAQSCGIVGSRNCSANGKKFTREIAAGLGEADWTVISGLARGIDTASHEASMEHGTVAVIATGIDVHYPPENADLQKEIAKHGCVVTEMPPGTRPRGELFPRRNRIIAGLSVGVIVVEAAMRSGSLITARLANEMGRDVFAVPGSPYDPRSQGTNKLIKDGAYLAGSLDDVLPVLQANPLASALPANGFAAPELSYEKPEPISETKQDTLPEADNDSRKIVLNLLGADPVHIDDLVRESALPVKLVQMILMELDFAGSIEHHAGRRISLSV